jgi:hypothetical protein
VVAVVVVVEEAEEEEEEEEEEEGFLSGMFGINQKLHLEHAIRVEHSR